MLMERGIAEDKYLGLIHLKNQCITTQKSSELGIKS